MEVIQNAASELLVNLVLGVLSVLGAYGIYWLRKGAVKIQEQTAQLKDEALRTTLDRALADVDRLATVTVGSIEQTAAGALRDAVKLGTADREELLALGEKAFEEVKAAVSPAAQEIINRQLGSFDNYLKNLIEDTVRRIKNESPYLTLTEEIQQGGGVDTAATLREGDAGACADAPATPAAMPGA